MPRTRLSWLDVKLGLRMLVKYPGLALVGGIAIAVAVAISAAAFTFFHSALYPRLPLDEGDRIVALENWNVRLHNEERQSLYDLGVWRQQMTTVRDVGAFHTVVRNMIAAGGPPEPIKVAEMTASGFQLARVRPLMGRYLIPADERPDAPPVLVIGHDVWRKHFEGDPAIVGRTVRLGNTVHTIVGVMPERFGFPVDHRYWMPLRPEPADYQPGKGPELFLFARLAPGVTAERAQAELATLGRRSAAALPRTHGELRPQVLTYTHPLMDIQDVTLWAVVPMQLMMSVLLLVVAVNVSILVYARTASRLGEIAVRTALGASRGRIVAQLFIESLVLSAAASAAGLALAQYALRQADRLMMMGLGEAGVPPFWTDYSLAPATVAYVVALALLTAVIAGVIPALQATGRTLQASLRQVSGGSRGGMGKVWTSMVIAQVGFAVAALPLAVGLAWNQVSAAVTRPAFDAGQYLAAPLVLGSDAPAGTDPATYRRALPARFGVLRGEMARLLAAESGVSAVSFASGLPSGGGPRRFEMEGSAPPADAEARRSGTLHVEPGFFAVFETPVLAGRAFTPVDADTAATSVMVNRAFVRELLGGAAAVGRRIRYLTDEDGRPLREPGRWVEIVGVVENMETNAMDAARSNPLVYHPLARDGGSGAMMVVRFPGGVPGEFAGRMRVMAASLDPSLRVGLVRSLDAAQREEGQLVRLIGLGLSLVTVTVLLLSAAGIYALMSFTVAQRRREIGIRSALGAHPRRLLAGIFSRAVRQLVLGLAAGIAIALLIDSAAGGELLGGRGAVLFPVVAAVMLVVGLLAAAGPARRGLRIQPSEALRAE